jgi:hypothetical protein
LPCVAATTEGAVWVLEQLREMRDRYGYEVAAILSGDRGARWSTNFTPQTYASFRQILISHQTRIFSIFHAK